MQWTDEGIIIGTRRHGETSLIVEVMTAGHGRHLGLVRGGRSRKQQPLLQPGNSVIATWRARLDEHLGNFTLEPVAQRAAHLMQSQVGLYGIQVLGALVRLLPERDPHPQVHTALAAVLDWLDDPATGAALVVRFEVLMLEELGFGLDLDSCAATGTVEELVFVSPKSGRAVSRVAGEPWRDRMLPLPGFLRESSAVAPAGGDLVDAFRMTGYFLDRHVYGPRGLEAPGARDRLVALVAGVQPAIEAGG